MAGNNFVSGFSILFLGGGHTLYRFSICSLFGVVVFELSVFG